MLAQREAPLGDPIPQRSEPFLVSAMVSFQWDPFESTRTYTTEEDLVTELLGRDGDPPDTMPRQLRTDVVLRAALPYDSRVPMPARTWRSWSLSVDDALSSFLPTDAAQYEGGTVIVMGWRGRVEAKSRCSEAGEICLSSVSLPSWQGVVPPRVRDAIDDEPEGDIGEQLRKLAKRYRGAYDAWMGCVIDLRDEIGPNSSDR